MFTLRIINIGVLAHVDAGKTSTVEQMLFQCGATRQLGSVDKGTAQTDWLPIERERGISVKSSSTAFEYNGTRINIIDTPGHMDFIGEVERALVAVDAVVLLVSAAEGIQSQTEILWRAIQELKIPCIFFVNKIDRLGCDPERVLQQLRREFTPAVIPLNAVRNAGMADCALQKAVFSEEDILILCENDEALAELFLSGTELDEARLQQSLAQQTALGKVFPLVYGSATMKLGITDLLEALTICLPPCLPSESAELSGIVYRIEHDKNLGRIAHLRLFSGSLRNRDMVNLRHRDGGGYEAKVTQIRRSLGAKYLDMGVVLGGDIAAVCGLSEARVGDIIGNERYHDYHLSQPVLTVRVSVEHEKQSALLEAVDQLAAEDPLLSYIWVPEKKELHLRIMGAIQREILGYLLKERYGLDVSFSTPSVIYKETPAKSGIGYEAYTMPKPCWAIVKLRIDPLARGSGYQFCSEVGLNRLPIRYQNHIETCLPEVLQQGRLGWEVTDLKVSLIDGESHLVHTHPLDFFLATPIAVQDGLANCGSQLLEPLLKFRLSADESLVSRLIGDILEMRGQFDNPLLTDGRVELEALVPVATSLDYTVRFAALTSGKGRLQSQFCGYQVCPLELGQTAERRGIDPLDRSKWILHKRGAIV